MLYIRSEYIINHDNLRMIVSHGLKFRELQQINWNYSCIIMKGSLKEYPRTWAKREAVEQTHSQTKILCECLSKISI